MRKSGLLEVNVIKHDAFGCYEAWWRYGDMEFKRSTFFPDDWSIDMIMKKVQESQMNLVKEPKLNKYGNWECVGKTQEGIEIFSVIDMQSDVAKTISFYPIMD